MVDRTYLLVSKWLAKKGVLYLKCCFRSREYVGEWIQGKVNPVCLISFNSAQCTEFIIKCVNKIINDTICWFCQKTFQLNLSYHYIPEVQCCIQVAGFSPWPCIIET